MQTGWIKLHRGLLKSDLWKRPEDVRLFLWLLLNVDREGKLDASLRYIANGLAEKSDPLRPTQIRRMLARLEKRGSIIVTPIVTPNVTQNVTLSGTRITVTNWEAYQQKPKPSVTGSVTPDVTPTVTPDVTNTRSKYKTKPKPFTCPASVLEAVSKINPKSRLTDSAKLKIRKRLESYTEAELAEAMENFGRDTWNMQNNSHRGLAWLFHSDDRIDQFLNLKPRAEQNGNAPVTLETLKTHLAKRS